MKFIKSLNNLNSFTDCKKKDGIRQPDHAP